MTQPVPPEQSPTEPAKRPLQDWAGLVAIQLAVLTLAITGFAVYAAYPPHGWSDWTSIGILAAVLTAASVLGFCIGWPKKRLTHKE